MVWSTYTTWRVKGMPPPKVYSHSNANTNFVAICDILIEKWSNKIPITTDNEMLKRVIYQIDLQYLISYDILDLHFLSWLKFPRQFQIYIYIFISFHTRMWQLRKLLIDSVRQGYWPQRICASIRNRHVFCFVDCFTWPFQSYCMTRIIILQIHICYLDFICINIWHIVTQNLL